MLDELLKIAEGLNISEVEKQLLFDKIKAVKKNITVIEFKYNRTLVDKAAIKNVLNASIKEIEKQKRNIEIAKNELDFQKSLTEQKNSELNLALTNLKATQAQLIQAEKMASLGELTAGIAHEIQNPLNFVNNFSELNNELINELKDEIAAGNLKDITAIANDIKLNSEKINHHGKRAENIVRGMLEHSRKSSGLKEPTDVNSLCREFVRLAYHGLRAKDKDFVCDYKLILDPDLPMVNVVTQEFERVILNIVNNAFQACYQQAESLKPEMRKNYNPLVVLTTKFSPMGTSAPLNQPNGQADFLDTDPAKQICEIHIIDNGTGIPYNIKDKIFQPFFTTKPSGQGTGLGLSLAYDIVKAHGGELTMNTVESEGSEFIIKLPIV